MKIERFSAALNPRLVARTSCPLRKHSIRIDDVLKSFRASTEQRTKAAFLLANHRDHQFIVCFEALISVCYSVRHRIQDFVLIWRTKRALLN